MKPTSDGSLVLETRITAWPAHETAGLLLLKASLCFQGVVGWSDSLCVVMGFLRSWRLFCTRVAIPMALFLALLVAVIGQGAELRSPDGRPPKLGVGFWRTLETPRSGCSWHAFVCGGCCLAFFCGFLLFLSCLCFPSGCRCCFCGRKFLGILEVLGACLLGQLFGSVNYWPGGRVRRPSDFANHAGG